MLLTKMFAEVLHMVAAEGAELAPAETLTHHIVQLCCF